MLLENTTKYYKEGYNCAESLILASNDAYNLGLDEKTAKVMSAFGGGCGCGHICGALAGALGAIAALTVTDRAHTTPDFNPLRADFMAKFEAELGSHMCNDLKPKYRTEEDGCVKTCQLTAELLAAYLTEKGLVK